MAPAGATPATIAGGAVVAPACLVAFTVQLFGLAGRQVALAHDNRAGLHHYHATREPVAVRAHIHPRLAAAIVEHHRVESAWVVPFNHAHRHPLAVAVYNVLFGVEVVVAIDFGNVVTLRALGRRRPPGGRAHVDIDVGLGTGGRGSGQQRGA